MHARHRLGYARRRLHVQLADEPGRAQHPERIVAEGHLRIQGRVQDLRRQVLHTTERIDELPVGQPHGHRVDREVPPGQVVFDVFGERHRRLAVGGVVDLLAERGDLHLAVALERPYRPELHAHQVLPIGPPPEDPRGVRGGCVGCEVIISARGQPAEDEVANHATHQIQLVAGGVESLAELRSQRVYIHPGHGVTIPGVPAATP